MDATHQNAYTMKFLIFTLLCFTHFAHAQDYRDSLTLKLDQIVSNSKIPGVSVAIVTRDTILYQGAVGYADIETQKPYTTNTIQNIASISKTCIAFALMKLVEEGKLGLDDPINDYLDFDISNPRYPDTPITLRHLATHTSSLTDGKNYMTIENSYQFFEEIAFKRKDLPKGYYKYMKMYAKNTPMSMEDFIRNAYVEGGQFYNKHMFLKEPPGTTYSYSNIASTLMALIIEKVSGKSFDTYIKEILFEPLGLTSSYWDFKEVPVDQRASLYLSNGLKIPHYCLITYPEAGWCTNVEDFSKYYMEMIRGYYGESDLLTQASYREMMTNQLVPAVFPNIDTETSKGLFWTVNKDGDNISADGSDPGVGTTSMFTTEGDVGVIIFRNMSYDDEDLVPIVLGIQRVVFQHIAPIYKQLLTTKK